ncbi:MAG: hypothetical protein HDQ88_08865 [Clostridia bacterium]|nr:hypothetical protein [Clostridia bacterium]
MAFIIATHKKDPRQEVYLSHVTNKSNGNYCFDTIRYARIFDSKEDAEMLLKLFSDRIDRLGDYDDIRIV